MKYLVFVLCLFPAMAQAQITTRTFLFGPAPLVRMDKDRDCDVYPQTRANGTVKLHYSVGADGRIAAADITGSSGDSRLDRQAAACVRSWNFLPLQQTGAAAPFQADAMVTYSKSGYRFDARVNWVTPQLKEAADLSAADLTMRALACLRETPGIAEAAATATFSTRLYLQFSHGEVAKVQLRMPSGNDLLDRSAVACFQRVPPDFGRAAYLKDTPTANLDLPWSSLGPRLRAGPASAR